jgi:prolipoprotein diacylglyceryl transferase
MTAIGSLPSPSFNTIPVGPLSIHVYGVLIAIGAFAAVSWAARRWEAGGGQPGAIQAVAVWALPGGLVGARLYHVATDPELFRGRWLAAFAVWQGGLGIWGGVAGGVLAGALAARRHGFGLGPLLDAAAPAIPLAQAIGRWGNWFNQELFGRPTGLPWGLRIDPAHRPPGYERVATFHPTFLYESLWDLAVVAIVLAVERHFRLRPGRLFAVYVVAYTFGRFFVELLRIDTSHRMLGLRLNDWTSIVVFVAGALFLLRRDTGRRPIA